MRPLARLRPLLLEDLPQLLAIEARSSPNPWPAEAYFRELSGNRFAHYLAAEIADAVPRMVGYGGLWSQMDEMHVSMIAVDPAWRRRGIGATVLAGLLKLGARLGCRSATLEVRAGNLSAQALYRAFGFRELGRRKGYYPAPATPMIRDGDLAPLGAAGEDALIMTTPDFGDPDWRQRMRDLPPEFGWIDGEPG